MGERARDLAAQIMSEVEKLPNRASVPMASIRFDSYQNAWWDIDTAYSYREPRSLNSIVRKEEWPYKEVVDSETGKLKQVLIKPSEFTCIMDNNQTVDNSTWWPGLPALIQDKLLIGADLLDYPGKLMFNTYRPPPKFERPRKKKAWRATTKPRRSWTPRAKPSRARCIPPGWACRRAPSRCARCSRP